MISNLTNVFSDGLKPPTSYVCSLCEVNKGHVVVFVWLFCLRVNIYKKLVSFGDVDYHDPMNFTNLDFM